MAGSNRTDLAGPIMTDSARPDPSSFAHTPVLRDEIVALVAPVPAGIYLDATLGGAGHAMAVLEHCPHLRLLGIDQDPLAIEAATARLVDSAGASSADRVTIVRARFDRLAEILDDLGIEQISGFLFDLGVSSPQLDLADRGFSFRHDGPLDMRMDPDAALSADEVVNTYDEARLRAILERNADERFAGRIARAVVAARPIVTTAALADVVVAAIPAAARRTGGHPAKRTFQAIRIHVNDELGILRRSIEDALDALCPGGRGLVLTYHSGEDKIVKTVFRDRTTVDTPPGLPVAVAEADYEIVRPAARKASADEVDRNPRAASARLRVIERRTAVAA